MVKREVICLSSREASYYLTEFIEAMGVEKTKEWLARAKGIDDKENI